MTHLQVHCRHNKPILSTIDHKPVSSTVVRTTMEDLKSQIEKRNAEFISLYDAGDFESLARDLYTPDCKMIPPGADAMHGHEAVKKLLGDDFKSGWIKLTLDTNEVLNCGDVAVERGRYTFFKSDNTIGANGNYVAVWKSIDGKWYYYMDIFN